MSLNDREADTWLLEPEVVDERTYNLSMMVSVWCSRLELPMAKWRPPPINNASIPWLRPYPSVPVLMLRFSCSSGGHVPGRVLSSGRVPREISVEARDRRWSCLETR